MHDSHKNSALRNGQSNTLSMKEMYKMNWLLSILLYAISEIVQCEENIKNAVRLLAQFVLTALNNV